MKDLSNPTNEESSRIRIEIKDLDGDDFWMGWINAEDWTELTELADQLNDKTTLSSPTDVKV